MPSQLPTIDLAGTEFFVDVALKQFRQAGDPLNTIQFNDIQRRVDASFILAYDIKSKGLYPWENASKPYPPHVIEIDVPAPHVLDPVAFEPIHRGHPRPTFWIGETAFEVDVFNMELIEKDDPGNKIRFGWMDDHGDYYEFPFDRKDKTMSFLQSDDWVFVRVPQMTQLDPVGMANKHGLAVHYVLGKTDFELMVDQTLLARRKNGELPTLRIGDTELVVDIPRDGLREKGSTAVVVDFGRLRAHEDDVLSPFYFDTKTARAWEPPAGLLSIPDSIVMAKIPPEEALDPYGYAIEHHVSQYGILKLHPPLLHFRAEVYDISQSGLPKLVQANRLSFNAPEKEGEPLTNGKRI